VNNKQTKLSVEEFVKAAIRNLRDKSKSLGINPVRSGFNAAFKEYFGAEADPVEATKKLHEEGKIVVSPRKGYVMLYLPEDAGEIQSANGKKALAAILG
jgi:hypothetical protein